MSKKVDCKTLMFLLYLYWILDSFLDMCAQGRGTNIPAYRKLEVKAMETLVSKIVRLVCDEIVYIVYDIYSEIKVAVILTVREIVRAILQ